METRRKTRAPSNQIIRVAILVHELFRQVVGRIQNIGLHTRNEIQHRFNLEVAENDCLQVPQGTVVVKLARPKICEQLLLDQSFGSLLQPLGPLRGPGRVLK